MKTTMLMLLSLLFVFAFTNQSSAQISFDCPDGYTEGDSIVVDTIFCYQVSVKYCYKKNPDNGSLGIHFSQVSYWAINEGCNVEDFTQYLDDHYDELLEKHTKVILAEIRDQLEIPLVFCEEGQHNILEASTAACASKTLVAWYAPGRDPNGPMEKHYWRPKCSVDSYCMSTYKLCWKWDGLNTVAELILLHRHVDMYDTCPNTRIINEVGMPKPVEVECKTICE